jgi:regulator of sirC expression with transglutaminase-like and TPR domain
VATVKLSSSQKQAFCQLIDDPSPKVREAMVKHLQDCGTEAIIWLRELANSSDTSINHHAEALLSDLAFSNPVSEFFGFICSLKYELETGIFLMSRTAYPSLKINDWVTGLNRIAQRCRELITEPMTSREKCRILNRVIFFENEFTIDYGISANPKTLFCPLILKSKKSSPFNLSILYALIAERCNLRVEPVDVPNHSLVGCFSGDTPFFINPSTSGTFISAEEATEMIRSQNKTPDLGNLTPMPIREVLRTLCQRISGTFSQIGDTTKATLFTQFAEEFDATYKRNVD